MKEIKRYRTFTHDDGDGFPYTDEEIVIDGEWVKYTDHKAVVETLKIEDLRKQECIYLLHKQVDSMQNKIEELSKLNKSLRCCENCDNKDNKITPNTMGYLRTCYECEECSNWTVKGIE